MSLEAGADVSAGLSAGQIERYWEDGFLVLEDVFTTDEVKKLQSALEQNDEDQRYKKSDQTLHTLNLTERHPAFLALAKDLRIVSRLKSLLGPDIQLHHSKLAAKPLAKGQGPYFWHQDYAYFPHTNTDLAAVMVMLDDATPENGCMNMLRGSHKLGLLNHMDDRGYFTGGCVESGHWEQHPENVMPVTPRVGGISIHHCLTLHGSGSNLSGRPRRGLVFQYRAADAYQMADDVFADTGLIVCGEYREHSRCTAGTVRLPKFNRWGRSGFGAAWNQVGAFAKRVNEGSAG